MKILSIGRGDDCDIIIEDSQNQISRRHATLRLYPLGKMEIIPEGRNGTFVNGMLLKPGQPRKVTRKDVISFAHVKQLNWKQVPDMYRKWRIIIACCIAAIILIIAGIKIASLFGSPTPSIVNGGGSGEASSSIWEPSTTIIQPSDNLKPAPSTLSPQKEEKEKRDIEKEARRMFPEPKKKIKKAKSKEEVATPIKSDSSNVKKQILGIF